jgi:uncharacterized membrane protein YdbT with pleckstrin-like domain
MSPLPKWSDETVLWEGAPGWLAVARTVFHVRFVALYFALVIVGDAARNRLEGLPRLETIRAELPLVALAVVACAIVLLLAWMTARTTAYAITDRRVVVRFGIAFPATLSLPLRMIQEVQVRVHAIIRATFRSACRMAKR